MKISRHQIIAFAAVGQEKSFSKAAKQLKLGQSAVTQHISALEESIGVKLFIRSRSGAELTQVGLQLFALADRIRVLEETFYESANQYADLTEGSLSICVSTPRPAMTVISAFQNSYPGVTINLSVSPWREALTRVQQREVDVAIVMRPETSKGLHVLEIERRPFVAILPKDHVLAKRQSIRFCDMLDETLVLLSESSYTQFCINKKLESLNLTTKNTLTTSSYEMLMEAVIQKLGVAVVLQGSVTMPTELETVAIAELSELHSYALVCSDDKASLRAVKKLFDIAAQGVQSNGEWTDLACLSKD